MPERANEVHTTTAENTRTPWYPADALMTQPSPYLPDPSFLAAAIRAGDRGALSRAITLVESTRSEHERQAADLLQLLLPDTGRSQRVGITGAPGAGKSTFLDALGVDLIARGHRVAVLAVDPSSRVTGGSILGDKTRMERLGREANAFIRPSPGGGTLGGIARRTRESMLLCEAAGFDVVLVETIGVGQSEIAVSDMVDCVVLLLLAGAGDELQGIKRGIMEVADVVVVHKADGDDKPRAAKARSEYEHALMLLRPPVDGWHPPVLTCSSRTGDGVHEVWSEVQRLRDVRSDKGRIALRSRQAVRWFESAVEERLSTNFLEQAKVRATLPRLSEAVASGRMHPTAAALELLRVGGVLRS